MASTADEFRELLNAEVFVEISKIRNMSKHGIPDEVRGEVWRYLLGVQHSDKTKELTSAQERSNEYHSFEKDLPDINRVKGEIRRYQPEQERFREKSVATIFEHVICSYVNNHRGVEFSSSLVHLCGPFVFSIRIEHDTYYCFERLMKMIEEHFEKQSLNERLARFTVLFRTIIPDLFNYFEEEEVDFNSWALEWLNRFLSRELPFQCLLRLWDTYFAEEDGLELHTFVCIAILKYFKDLLDDFEHSEILSFLRHLPAMDMDQIITEAKNLKDDISTQEMM